MNKIYFILALSLFISFNINAQDSSQKTSNQSDIYHNWYNKSATINQIYGAEVDKAYELLLKDKTSTTVIVAVIDGGIDINHEDLKDNIWINTNEIPDNGIDDDNNGYIDDINGWNFLGNDKGEYITFENLEMTRIYKQYKDKYENIEPKNIPENEKETYNLFIKASKLYNSNLNDALETKTRIESFEEAGIEDSCQYMSINANLVAGGLRHYKNLMISH